MQPHVLRHKLVLAHLALGLLLHLVTLTLTVGCQSALILETSARVVCLGSMMRQAVFAFLGSSQILGTPN